MICDLILQVYHDSRMRFQRITKNLTESLLSVPSGGMATDNSYLSTVNINRLSHVSNTFDVSGDVPFCSRSLAENRQSN